MRYTEIKRGRDYLDYVKKYPKSWRRAYYAELALLKNSKYLNWPCPYCIISRNNAHHEYVSKYYSELCTLCPVYVCCELASQKVIYNFLKDFKDTLINLKSGVIPKNELIRILVEEFLWLQKNKKLAAAADSYSILSDCIDSRSNLNNHIKRLEYLYRIHRI